MEHSHKNTDCYFFYYSTCKKGELCPFRHEPSALGCETMCSYWQQGNCLNEHCSFRHMELKKNRKSIPCYWEAQPSGCRKPHCPFLHKNVRAIYDPINPVKANEVTSKPINQDWVNRQDDAKYDTSSAESDQGRGSSEAGSFIGSPAVDPLIVKFGEESDNESVPSPVKMQPPQPRVPYCKTYEEIRLEEIQAESAAYYSYNAEDYSQGLADRSLNKYYSTPMSRQYANVVLNNTTTMTNNNRQVLRNSEIRRKIRVDPTTIIIKNEDNNVEDEDDEDKESMIPDKKKLKVDNINKNKKKKKKKWSNDDNDNDESNNELNFKILSLDEIRRRKISKTSLIQGVDDERLENVKSDLSKMFDEKRTPAENVISVVEDPGKTITNPLLIRMPDINFLPINRGIKRVLEKDDKGTTKIDDNNRRVKTKFNENYNNLVKVPPVRLRRSSPRRCLINITINESIVTKQDKDENKGEEIPTTVINDDNNLLLISDQTDLINKEVNEIDDNVERNNENLTRRLDENLDVRVNSRDSNHSNNITGRKNEVEVRLCDSSTDEERMRIIDNDESNKTFDDYAESEKTKSVVIIDTITEEDSKASRLSCDSILNINDDEYLTLDTASDDILKDIDALLKDKPVL